MRVFNNEMVIRRGETFTIDKTIVNRDGSPYVISNQLTNPYFLLTITNALYDKKDRYIYNAWLPIVAPKFRETTPVNLSDFKSIDGETLYYDFDDVTGLPSGYLNDVLVTYTDEDDAIFYLDKDGVKDYRYYDNSVWRKYECRIIVRFDNDTTKEWIEQNYFYSIDLISGMGDNTDSDKPITLIEEIIPILESTKMTVSSNLKGGLR